jgi:uncharacterized membrane protein
LGFLLAKNPPKTIVELISLVGVTVTEKRKMDVNETKTFIILALLIISPVKGQSLGQLDYYVAVYNTYYQASGVCPLLASSTPIFRLKSPGDSFSPLIVNNN